MVKSNIKSYQYLTKDRMAADFLLETLDSFNLEVGNALDLGCASGNDSLELMNRGWNVTSIDKSKEGFQYLKGKVKSEDKIQIINESFENMKLKKSYYDLIYSRFSLSFCQREDWNNVWNEIKESLKPNGTISLNFFGVNDGFKESSLYGNMTFFSPEDVLYSFQDFTILRKEENEYDSKTKTGQIKHWHVFKVIAKKK